MDDTPSIIVGKDLKPRDYAMETWMRIWSHRHEPGTICLACYRDAKSSTDPDYTDS